jgi:predicted TIM-barrel fold metal-dependent hydrolase
MKAQSRLSAAQVRQRLGHPVVDADGHVIEYLPALVDCLKRVAGPKVSERFWSNFLDTNARNWHQLTPEQRRRGSVYRPAFWAGPAENTRDRATAMLPKLLEERLPELGMDYAVMFPTIGMLLPNIVDEEMRRASCRAENLMLAEMFKGCEARLTPAAIIPCHTPAEALEEMRFAFDELGMRVPMIGAMVRRPIRRPDANDEEPKRPLDQAFWVDLLGLDSEYDYDPLWRECMERRVPMTFHAPSQGVGLRRSTSNYMFNQTGHFADSGHAYAKALFFGGVTYRFPRLPMAFLECGAAWGAQLVLDLKERWEKRNAEAIKTLDPRRVNQAEMARYFERYGGSLLAGKLSPESGGRAEQPMVDEFAATGIRNLDDFYERLLPNYYYGCEADDRLAGVAFDPRYTPPGRPLKAMFSSDIGHWDVEDMERVVPEAWEMVEDGVMSEESFRDFMFTNPVRLLTSLDPEFFKGTAVESEVKALLASEGAQAAKPRRRA